MQAAPIMIFMLSFPLMQYVSSSGQEAHEGIVRCAGSPTELLQLHSTRIKRDVPQVLHPLPALQSPEIPSPLGWSSLQRIIHENLH